MGRPTDAIVFALRLVGASGGIARDRLLEPWLTAADGIPKSPQAIDARWLTAALQAQWPGLVVKEATRVAAHSGTTTRARVRLVAEGSAPGAAIPETLFLKITPGSFRLRLFTSILDLGGSEVRFYRDLRDAVPIRTPRAYCARTARRGARFVLLLEDLAASGCRFPEISSPVDLSRARTAVTVLGRLHAAFWESPRFAGDLAWLRCRENNPNAPIERIVSYRANAPALARVPEGIPDSVRRDSQLIAEHRELLEDYWASGPRTLIHGDPHVGNMFFEGDEVGLLDWQVVQRGEGIRDVAYFLVNSIETDLRRAHQDELLALYRDTLRENGVGDLDDEDLWTRYRSYALYSWVAAAVTTATPGLQPESIGRLGLRRAGAAVEDLDALGVLRALIPRSGRGRW